ncbi:hypothetical protein ACIF80_17070 [Streptomyces sp. NPDC085927]
MQADTGLEVPVDVTRDHAGRPRHPARPHRMRTGIEAQQVPLSGKDSTSS